MIKGVFFDMDGVLVDSRKAWYVLFNKALEHFEGKTVSQELFDREIFGSDIVTDVNKYFTKGIEEVKTFFFEHDHIRKKHMRAFGAKEVLQKLKEKEVKLAVVTNAELGMCNLMLKEIGIFDYFDQITAVDMVPKPKPYPDSLLFTLEKLNLSPDEILYVGDTLNDKKAAKAANVFFVGFRQEGNKRIEELQELLDLV